MMIRGRHDERAFQVVRVRTGASGESPWVVELDGMRVHADDSERGANERANDLRRVLERLMNEEWDVGYCAGRAQSTAVRDQAEVDAMRAAGL